MKILQVNNYYGERSTGKLTAQLHQGLLAAGHQSLVAYGRGGTVREPGTIRLCPEWYAKANSLLVRLTGMPHGGCRLSTGKLLRLIRREKPDVVHLQCINEHFVDIYRLLGWLNRHDIPTVLSLHAEFIYTGNCGHAYECDKWKHGCHHCHRRYGATKSLLFDRTAGSWRRMRRALEGFEDRCIVTPVSPWTQERAKQGDILKNFRFRTVLNGVDTHIMAPQGDRKALRAELGLPDGKLIMNISHHFDTAPGDIKGGHHILELAKRLPEVTFLVAGRYRQGLELPENIRLLGFLSDQRQLARYYSAADLTLSVGKRETFSMPCAESLCCGTPVAGFKAGAPEQISLPQYSDFVEHGDLDALETVVRRWLAADPDPAQIGAAAKTTYSVETMIRGFLEVYECLTDSEN